MSDRNNVPNNKSTNKSKKPISASTKTTYDKRLKSVAITDYTNIDEVSKQLDKVENLGTRKSSCNALIYYYNSQLTPISSADKILELLHNRLNTLSDKINYDRQEK